MLGETYCTTDYAAIRRWMQARNIRPTIDTSTGRLVIGYPGYQEVGVLEEISWGEFYERLDREGLALMYQEETALCEISHWARLVRYGPEANDWPL